MTIRLFEPLAGVSSAQGLDVSNFQGPFNWATAKKSIPGLAFGICRVTQGLGGTGLNSPDPQCAHNFAEMAAQKLIRGAYHFLSPHLSGTQQAQYFVQVLKTIGVTETDMLFLDNETAGTSPAIVAACAQQFMTELRKLMPHNPIGVYTFIDFARQGNCAGLGKYPLWLAFPASKAPVEPLPWLAQEFKFWQWGIRNGDDADAFMGTAAELEAWIKGFAPKPVSHSVPAPGQLSQTPYDTYVDLGWGSAGTGLTYHYQVEDMHGLLVADVTQPLSTSARLLDLKPYTTYTWRVSATPHGAWSSWRPFTTKAKPSLWSKIRGGF